jgi:ketosteroid isomerase-like protein
MMQGGRVARGTRAIRKAIATFATMKPRCQMNVHRIVKAGDGLAMLYNDWTLSATEPDGVPFADRGRAIEIVRRERNGTWRFTVDDPRARG